MSTFIIYKLSAKYIRRQIVSKLAWSVKYLIDAWPEEEFNEVSFEGDKFLRRIFEGDIDGCDFILHHSLLKSLINDK